MGYLVTSLVLCPFLFFSALASLSCWTPRTEDIDWNRVSSPWWDVMDVPLPEEPTGCWKANNFTLFGGNVLWQFEVYSQGEKKATRSKEYLFFRRKSPAVYTLDNSGAQSLLEAFQHIAEKSTSAEDGKDEIAEVVNDLVTQEWTFLTDYATYLMFVACGESGWHAFVKAPTHHISTETLWMISQDLVDNGLQSPTMTLKNECLDTGDAKWNKADVVIV